MRPKREVIVDCRVPILSVELVLWSLDFGSNGVIDNRNLLSFALT